MMYDETNIDSTYVDCVECNKPCYKLIACDGLICTIATDDVAFEAYVGKTIKWIDTQAAGGLQKERCATVDRYTCRRESYQMAGDPTVAGCFHADIAGSEATLFSFAEITIIDCYDTCAECEYIAPDPVIPDPVYGRKVKPGYDVPECGPLNN